MKAFVTRSRMAMDGAYASYDVYVLVSSLPPEVVAKCDYFIHPAGYDYRAMQCALFPEAFYTPEMLALPAYSAERSAAFKAASERAGGAALSLLKAAYPELADADKVPALWRECPADTWHDSRVVDFDPAAFS